jgi:hypothetical protein
MRKKSVSKIEKLVSGPYFQVAKPGTKTHYRKFSRGIQVHYSFVECLILTILESSRDQSAHG